MSTLKRWMGLGLGAALIAGCTPAAEADKAAEGTPTTARQMGAGPGEGGGEGGESGEGGVDVAAAATDPVVYLTALAVVEAHVRAAAAAAAAGERQAAGEMFAHPVSEVLLDMAATFTRLGVAPFDAEFSAASAAVFDGAAVPALQARADALLRTLDQAGDRAPADGADDTGVAARVIADLIDRAALQYGTAGASSDYEPYLDGYGFYVTAKAWRDARVEALRREAPEALAAIDAALTALASAYPGAARPATLNADGGALMAAASRVRLATTR